MKKVLIAIASFFAIEAIGKLFDYVLYPIVTYIEGVVKGFFILFVTAFFINILFVAVYDLFDRDFIGFEALKNKTSDEVIEKGWLRKVLSFGKFGAFFAFSYHDPIYAILFFRDKRGFSLKTVYIALLSTAVGCIIWSGIVGSVVTFVPQLIPHEWMLYFQNLIKSIHKALVF